MPLLNQPVKAYFMAIVRQGTEHEVAKRVRRMAGVTEVVVTYGLYDIVVRIEAEDLRKLDALITEIRKLQDIVQTSTFSRRLANRISERSSVFSTAQL